MFIVAQFTISLFFILAYYIIWFWIFDHLFSISDIVGLIALIVLLNWNVLEYVDFYKTATQEFTQVQNLWDTFDRIKQIKWYNTWLNFIYKRWDIKIDNLTYGYKEDKVFKNFNLEIKGWLKTAFVWVSWSGKSTLVKLIAGYLHPEDEWNIIIDGQNLKQVKLKSYYQNIWYLTQDPSVFDGTILENLTYWIHKTLSLKEIKKMIKMAECDFIFEFKDWLDTEIWERWIRLSWWQRQRLAIAKLFIKDPKIIILDEPTSSLDSFSEEKISIALKKLFKWRTVIVVAHRLQTVKEADNIILLQNWKIIEKWTHKELLKKKWIYYRMIELQSWF